MDGDLLGDLAFGLELRHQLCDLRAYRPRLHRDHVELLRRLAVDRWAVEVRKTDPVALRLARADEARQLRRAVLRVEHNDVVAQRRAREEAEQRARVQIGLLAPHALQPRAKVLLEQLLPRLAFDAAPAPVEL